MGEPPFESDDVTLRRRNPWSSAAALLLGAVIPIALIAIALVLGLHALPWLAPLSALAGLLLYGANLRPRERLGRIVVNELGVFFDGRRLASRSEVREGTVVTVPGDAPLVRLALPGGVRELRVKNMATGRRLLRAIGVEGQVSGRSVRLSSRVFHSPGAFARVALVAALLPPLFAAIGFASHGSRVLFVGLVGAAAAMVAFVLASVLSSTTVEVGEEGLAIRWLGRRRRIGYADVVSARLYEEAPALSGRREQGIAILLRSGELVRLPAGSGSDAEGLPALLERIEDAIGRSRRGEAAPEEAMVARRGRPLPEWLKALRALGSGARADHRTAPLPSDVLWRLVEDAGAAPEARAGAAVALSGSLDDAGRTRLRVAAEKTDLPRLRVAIEAAATGDDGAAVEQALAELEATEAPAVAALP